MGHSSSSDSDSDHGHKKHHKKHHKKKHTHHEGRLHGDGHHGHHAHGPQRPLHGGPLAGIVGGILGQVTTQHVHRPIPGILGGILSGHSSGHVPVAFQHSDVPQHGTSGIQHNASGIHHSTSGIHHSTSGIHHSTSGIHHNASGIQYSTSGIHHNTSGMHHNTSGMHHNTSGVHHGMPHPTSPPPSYSYSPNPIPPPPSGHRIPLDPSSIFPGPSELGPPPFFEADRRTSVYIGSALFDRSVQPCKIAAHLQPHALAAYGGKEHGHNGRYDLLPFVPELMEFVPTSHGHIPHGRRPVEGGYEGNGNKLYHAAATVKGVRVPGKTGSHLGGCHVGYAGTEYSITENYEILCWR